MRSTSLMSPPMESHFATAGGCTLRLFLRGYPTFLGELDHTGGGGGSLLHGGGL